MVMRVKRVYEPASDEDGLRVLVDRLWPRGLAKASARIDLWLKEVAPSDDLRRWFDHDPDKWAEFQRRYRAELEQSPEALRQLDALRGKSHVTLLFGAREAAHNNAVALQRYLGGGVRQRRPAR